jgi:outer membrane protein assembly factor BamB
MAYSLHRAGCRPISWDLDELLADVEGGEMITDGTCGIAQLPPRLRFAAALALLFLVPAHAVAGDWPQFRGPARDARSTDTELLQEWPENGPELLWTKTGLGAGYTQAIVVDGTVYVTGSIENEGYVHAFDLDGTPLWRESYGPVFAGMRRGYAGARSAPTVSGGKLYVAGSGGQVVCLEAKSGKRVWSVDFFGKFGVTQHRFGFSESVLVDGDNVLLTTGGKTLMVALHRNTGEVVWTTEGIGDASSYCSPMIVERGGTRQIVTISHAHVVGIDAKTGVLIWKQPFSGGSRSNHATTPVYADGLLFCSAGYGKGSEILKLAEDGTSVTPLHTLKKPDNHHGNLVLVDGHVYGAGHQNAGQWVCVELATGEIKWEAKGVGKGSVSFADDLLYCYGERDGRVALVRPSSKGYEEISTFTVSAGSGEHWAHPTIAGGRLYIRHGDALMAYDVKAR